MEINRKAIALYGRFSPGERERLQREIAKRRGVVARDLTRRSDLLVIGALATPLIDCGALSTRLRSARERKIPVLSEHAFAALLAGDASPDAATLPLATVLAPTVLTLDDAHMLAAFDLIAVDGDNCRFADAGVIRTAGELIGQGRSRAEAVRILAKARDAAPTGRHKIVLTSSGGAALKWDNGLTTLDGQGLLPLDMDQGGVDELFEAAELAEARGDGDVAARLYDMCARFDRADAIALYNLGNIRLGEKAFDDSVIAYRRALARDSDFVEARYNLALALEAAGKDALASGELTRVLAIEPSYPDAVFNLAQLLMKAGEIAKAKNLYERYLALDPPSDWAATARKAITYCSSRLSA